jgi:hypothetical protein
MLQPDIENALICPPARPSKTPPWPAPARGVLHAVPTAGAGPSGDGAGGLAQGVGTVCSFVTFKKQKELNNNEANLGLFPLLYIPMLPGKKSKINALIGIRYCLHLLLRCNI